jgi:hypothetical protein
MMKNLLSFLIVFIFTISASAQDLLSQLQSSGEQEKEYIYQTFKGTRIVNGFSVETKGKRELEFIITHRFGRLNLGTYEFFGLDNASIRIGFEYGLTNNIGIGIGRSSHNKIYDGYLKYRVVQQAKGGGSPVTVTLVGTTGLLRYDSNRFVPSSPKLTYNQSTYFSGHALIARKFTPSFSMQISPVLLHANLVSTGETKTLGAVGFGARYKLTKSLSINGEYFHRLNAPDNFYQNCVGLGIDIETGGHVFQLIFSNTSGMVDRTYLGNTDGDISKGDINFGFNLTRTFQTGKKKESKVD